MYAIVRKEIQDAFKNRLFLLIASMLMLLVIISVILGALQVKANVDAYNQSIEFLKSIGKTELPEAPNLNPLSALKSYVNYIGILGALIAIVQGNLAIAKDKRNGTMPLILTRHIYRDQYLSAKLIGNMALLLLLSVSIFVITLLSMLLISRAPITWDDIARMGVFSFLSFLYMSLFLILSLFLAVLSRNTKRALLLTVVIWLVISFILPQIGDTMDLDNQLPGGFFSSMGMNKEESQKILDKFSMYETIRDGIEEMSPTKHYERASFALLNVKPGFESNTALEISAIKWFDIAGILAPGILLWLGAFIVFLKREDINEVQGGY